MYYLIGIKGAAMSALALVLDDLNFEVKGCDVEQNFFTQNKLEERNICIENISDFNENEDYHYIIGNAFIDDIKFENLENKTNYLDFVSKSLNEKLICVAGSHGKTTTTYFLAQLLDLFESNNYIIGDGTGVGNTDSNYLVIEACEYKRNFIKFNPEFLLITNVDYDHTDFYKTCEEYENAFSEICKKSKNIITFNNVSIKLDIGLNKDEFKYKFWYNNKRTYVKAFFFDREYFFDTNLKGNHNILNFLLCIKLLIKRNFDVYSLTRSKLNLLMPSRRYELFEKDSNVYICDYAHHPTEVNCLIESVKHEYKGKSIIAIYEHHTYSRYIKFKDDFESVLSLCDEHYYTKIFSSIREENQTRIKIANPISKYNIRALLSNKKDSVILFIGAGNIDKLFNFYIK